MTLVLQYYGEAGVPLQIPGEPEQIATAWHSHRARLRGWLAALPERLVFNCTGLGSRALFNDEELRPARGQLAILLPQPEVRYAFTGEMGYMFPRPDGIILGGSFELDRWEAAAQPERIARILERHRQFNAAFRCTT